MDEDAKNAPDNADFQKLVARESQRLRLSLDAAKRLKEDNPECEIIAFMHFPPFWNGRASEPLIDILCEYGVKRVYFGHIHGNYSVPRSIVSHGIPVSIISADYLNFIPMLTKIS